MAGYATAGEVTPRGIPGEDQLTQIGNLSLGPDFSAVLPWGLIGNRPYLRCFHGYGLCLWRLKRFEEAAAVFSRMLWMNPSDNQGARFNLAEVRDGREWRDQDEK